MKKIYSLMIVTILTNANVVIAGSTGNLMGCKYVAIDKVYLSIQKQSSQVEAPMMFIDVSPTDDTFNANNYYFGKTCGANNMIDNIYIDIDSAVYDTVMTVVTRAVSEDMSVNIVVDMFSDIEPESIDTGSVTHHSYKLQSISLAEELPAQ